MFVLIILIIGVNVKMLICLWLGVLSVILLVVMKSGVFIWGFYLSKVFVLNVENLLKEKIFGDLVINIRN